MPKDAFFLVLSPNIFDPGRACTACLNTSQYVLVLGDFNICRSCLETALDHLVQYQTANEEMTKRFGVQNA